MPRTRVRPNAKPAPQPPRKRTPALPPALAHTLALAPAWLVGAALYAPVLRLFFAQDDVTFLSRAAGLEPTPWSFARPLSEGLAWRLEYAAFGLTPMPYHAVAVALHLVAATLVYAIGLRLLRTRFAAGAAAFLFAVSSLGFTALHWASCIVELSMAVPALASLWAFLEARARHSLAWLWLATALAVAAALTKESALGLPLVLAVAAWRAGPREGRWRALLPVGAAFAVLALGFVATRGALPYGQYTGGTAYALDLAPRALFANLAMYLRWSVTLTAPFRERAIGAGGATPIIGLVLLAALAALLAWQWRDERHAAGIGAAWCAVFLLPVLPLAHHAYDYYLYVPFAGLCWLVVGACERVSARWPRVASAVAAAAALGMIARLEWTNVRTRESERLAGAEGSSPLFADKTLRESELLEHAVAGLRAAQLPRGAVVAFVNPFPRTHLRADGRLEAMPEGQAHTYIPLEGAMRGGETLRLFTPGVTMLGFTELPPAAWRDAEFLLFASDGTLTDLGHGAPALAPLADLLVSAGMPEAAEVMRRRAAEMARR